MNCTTEENTINGVSTAKALSVAMIEGQRIYTLTQDNQDQLSNINIDDGARSEISLAISQGLEVMVHQNPITVDGWVGSGYRILNTEYGSGVYKISGGASGGALIVIGFILLAALFTATLSFLPYIAVMGGWPLVIKGLSISLAVYGTIRAINDNNQECSGLVAAVNNLAILVQTFISSRFPPAVSIYLDPIYDYLAREIDPC